MLTRRGFLTGLIAAPAVVRVESLMPLRGIILPTSYFGGNIRREKVNKLIQGLHADGIWDKLETLWVFHEDFIVDGELRELKKGAALGVRKDGRGVVTF